MAFDFHFIKEIQKLYKGKYASGAFWLSFLTERYNQFDFSLILLHFQRRFTRHPYWCDLCPSSVICHRWHLTYGINDRCQRWHMTDDGHKSYQYGCQVKRLWKCSNLGEKSNWLDRSVRNESQNAPLTYFPLYNFRISFKNENRWLSWSFGFSI